MRMLFKQKFFSWTDSYEILDENEKLLYKVKGDVALSHQLRIYDKNDKEVGMVKESIVSLIPKFEIYEDGKKIGQINEKLTIIKPKFDITFMDWEVSGNIFEWDYKVVDSEGKLIMTATKVLEITDTYRIDVLNEKNALYALMIVLAIDAAKCSN